MTHALLHLEGRVSPDLEAQWMQQLEAVGQAHHWSELRVHQLQLVVEEWMENLLAHALAPQAGLQAILQLQDVDDELELTLSDSGQAFNPLTRPPPSLDLDLDQLQPGGWGLHFIRSLACGTHYERREDHNHLTLRFKK